MSDTVVTARLVHLGRFAVWAGWVHYGANGERGPLVMALSRRSARKRAILADLNEPLWGEEFDGPGYEP